MLICILANTTLVTVHPSPTVKGRVKDKDQDQGKVKDGVKGKDTGMVMDTDKADPHGDFEHLFISQIVHFPSTFPLLPSLLTQVFFSLMLVAIAIVYVQTATYCVACFIHLLFLLSIPYGHSVGVEMAVLNKIPRAIEGKKSETLF
jgi:hypothetical protein